MIPQLALLALGLILLPQYGRSDGPAKLAICALAVLSASIPFMAEAIAGRPEFLEPSKLLINLSTVALFLFLGPVFDPISCAKWLKRSALLWLLIVIAVYLYTQTSTWEMLLLLIEPGGLTSTKLYELAEPLAPIFLTKNIIAMYVVAVFGAFLYFRRSAMVSVSLLEKFIFLTLVFLLFSRQAILAAILLLLVDYFLAGRRKTRWALVALVIAALVIGAFFAFAFDFSSQEDGATTRLELWQLFFQQRHRFEFTGLGVYELNASLEPLNIDNYHMFFMNQIAAYGIVHCVAFNLLLTIIMFSSLPPKARWLLIAPYWLNVCFQTYGYEYGNLFLFCIAANSMNLQPRAAGAARAYPVGSPLPVN